VSVFDRETSSFQFHKGPVFSQLVLADEVNRATPKAQSALLEAMEEHQVTADGSTYPLAAPFFVIATQNPVYQIGTYPLPESQLDRFLMRIELGYPDPVLERQLLLGQDRRDLLATLPSTLSPQQLLLMQTMVPKVHVSDALLDYVQAIVRYTRESPLFEAGISPRAAIGLLRVAQAWALIHGHPGVMPEDVQAVLAGVVGHRLKPRDESAPKTATEIGIFVLKEVPVP
jgi:MoxR-like ATPase